MGPGGDRTVTGKRAANAADPLVLAKRTLAEAGTVMMRPRVDITPALDGVAVNIRIHVGDLVAGADVVGHPHLHAIDEELIVRLIAGEHDGPAHFAGVEIVKGSMEQSGPVGAGDVA